MYFQYAGDRGEACWSSAVPASQYAHPEFGLLCPTPRFRRRLHLALAGLVVGALGVGVMAARDGTKPDIATTGTDAAFIAGTIPGTSPSPGVCRELTCRARLPPWPAGPGQSPSSEWRLMIASRPGPTPTAETRAPMSSSSRSTYAWAAAGSSSNVRQPEMSSPHPSSSS